MGRGSKNNTRGRSTLDPQIKQLPGPLAAQPDGSVGRLAGKVRDTGGRRLAVKPMPCFREGALVKGFPLTPS